MGGATNNFFNKTNTTANTGGFGAMANQNNTSFFQPQPQQNVNQPANSMFSPASGGNSFFNKSTANNTSFGNTMNNTMSTMNTMNTSANSNAFFGSNNNNVANANSAFNNTFGQPNPIIPVSNNLFGNTNNATSAFGMSNNNMGMNMNMGVAQNTEFIPLKILNDTLSKTPNEKTLCYCFLLEDQNRGFSRE